MSFNLIKKGTRLYSILKMKCPRCQEGDLFLEKNPYKLRSLDKMPTHCKHCGENLQREVGFYYGAMMISHATTTVIAVIVHFTVFYFYRWEIAAHLLFLIPTILGLFPIIFRTSRAIWVNFFIRYDPTA